MKNVKEKELNLYKTRWAMTYLRGPMTLSEVAKITIYYHPKLKIYSQPEETLESFKKRVQISLEKMRREQEEKNRLKI